jgi:pimeloyl-ACP methyl ester carboxylesterase
VHVQVGNRTLSYSRRGAGDPLLLIMGMAGHQGLWGNDFLDLLARDFDVVTYDHRGIGSSTDDGAPFTIRDLTDDAVALLDDLGWDSANVFGISMGGMVAQELALTHPDRVRRLVLGCTYCGGAGSSLNAQGPMKMMAAMNSGVAEDAVRAGFHANLSPSWTADEEHWTEFSQLALSERVPVPVVMRQAQAVFAHNTASRLPGMTKATLVVAGTADDMLLYSNSELITSLLPNASMLSFPDVGHLFWWERPADTAEAIRAHLLGS